MEYGLIGEKLGQSFSKVIHEQVASYNYELKEVTKDEIDCFMKTRDFKCINVTIPYKETVIPYLDYISSEAQEIGSVNTIVNKDGKLYGYNTDFYGLKALILKEKIDVKGKKCLILGSGGTSKTAKYVLSSLGAKEVYIVSRYKKDGCITYEEAKNVSDVKIIINTTPCGMYPNNEDLIIDINDFVCLEAVIDTIYNPLNTRLIVSAKNKGITSVGGLYMLVAQAVKSIEYFLDKTIDNSVIEKTYKKVLKQKQNIVLIGMPSSGKSTIGNSASKIFNMILIDTDKMIEEKINMSINDYFIKFGEKAFRDLESDITRSVSKMNGVIISTGGGIILREENIDLLKQNGLIVFVNRDLELLKPTKNRPLSSDYRSLKERYEERIDIYKRVCDIEIMNNNDDFSLSLDELVKRIEME